MSGLHVSWFILAECPVPKAIPDDILLHLVRTTARLGFVHRWFAPEWLALNAWDSQLKRSEWKVWWAVTESDRVRQRIVNEVLIADAFGLLPENLEWIVRDDPSDPKAFWRVDKLLPYRERLTSLAAAAFRAFKEGKWSAETAADLSNDEFFDILGIPEMTNAQAAKAKGESGPLILKRDGCHVWRPENFLEDDPHYGWTWDDCWNDAVAVLGSEEAVRCYIEGKPEKNEEEHTGSRDLFGDPIIEKPKQRKLF